MIVAIILTGWVFSVFWKWFVAPVFGFKLLTIPQSIGLSVFVSYLKLKWTDYNDKDEDLFKSLLMEMSTPIFCLAVGWLIHCFI